MTDELLKDLALITQNGLPKGIHMPVLLDSDKTALAIANSLYSHLKAIQETKAELKLLAANRLTK